jgi:hypothetical protein
MARRFGSIGKVFTLDSHEAYSLDLCEKISVPMKQSILEQYTTDQSSMLTLLTAEHISVQLHNHQSPSRRNAGNCRWRLATIG